jgi:peroxiredoxin
MQQIVDLQKDPAFQETGVQILSIAFDTPEQLAGQAVEYIIKDVPLLTDTDHEVSETYDVMQWAVATGEPGHTFILVDKDGAIAWIRDYGAPENGGLMYVPSDELTAHIIENLN